MIFSLILLIACIYLYFYFKKRTYDSSLYKVETGNKFLKVLFDKGRYGEYLTSNLLDKIPGHHKILHNLYLLNDKGTTTEIDLLYLHETGVYVLESKNYSGWIFGKESDQKWCQSFQNGKKEYFYNPIKQNQTHLDVLQKHLPNAPINLFQSIIVFSERCTLKKIVVSSLTVSVIKRNELNHLFRKLMKQNTKILTKEMIDNWYRDLKPFTNQSESVKLEHIQSIIQRVN